MASSEIAVNEKSTAYLSITFKDKAGASEAPASATYQIDDVITGQAIRASTPITPIAAQVEITLAPADNVILLAAGKVLEYRRVTVIGVYNAGDQVTDEYIYPIQPLDGVS